MLVQDVQGFRVQGFRVQGFKGSRVQTVLSQFERFTLFDQGIVELIMLARSAWPCGALKISSPDNSPSN